MKDGTTHLAYKAEHVVDLESELVLAAQVYPADQPDSATLLGSVLSAPSNLMRAGSETDIEEAVTDKGYHKAQTLAGCAGVGVRSHIGEHRRPQRPVWTDKPAGWEEAYRDNRGRTRGPGAGACKRSGASTWSGRSPTSARREQRGGAGGGACRRCASAT
jgi:transposase